MGSRGTHEATRISMEGFKRLGDRFRPRWQSAVPWVPFRGTPPPPARAVGTPFATKCLFSSVISIRNFFQLIHSWAKSHTRT